ncbi:MAG: leucine-rich repeat protein, partial [Mycoplasma sp.]|nr:leucine-rich repeat protein [Candidatus Hennigella equi]
MKRTKLFLPLTIGLVSTSLLPLVACTEHEEKSETSVITFVVEGKGEVSANTLEVKTDSKWVDIKNKPTLSPYKYWKCDGLYLNGQKVKDETVISQDCTMTVKFVHDETQNKTIHFEVTSQEGTVEPTRTYWKGYTFGELKNASLLPTPSPSDLYVFDDGWYKDEECQYKVSDDTPLEELDYIYVDFILDPEVFSHIDFVLTPRYGQILEGGSIDVYKGTKWANVPHPVIQPANGYVVDQYLVNGSLVLTDDYVFENDDVITVTFKESTAQSKFKFALSNDKTYAILTSYAETGDKNIIVPAYYYNNNKVYPVKQIGDTLQGTHPVFDDGSIETVVIPETAEVIDTQIFSANCTNVASVTFPDSVTTFNGALFAGVNKNVTSLSFGKNVSTLFASIIDNLPNLGNIVVNEYNQTYYDGRTKGGSNCIIKVSDKSFVCGCVNSKLPNDLMTIGSNAFKGLAINEINIPASVRTIG